MIKYDWSTLTTSIVLTSIIRYMLDQSYSVDAAREMGAYALILDYCYTWTRIFIAISVMNFLNLTSPVAFVTIATLVELVSSGILNVMSDFTSSGAPLKSYIDGRTFDLRFVILQYVMLFLLDFLHPYTNSLLLAWSLIYYISTIYAT